MKKIAVVLMVLLLAAALWLQQHQPKDTSQTLPPLPSFTLADVQRVAINLNHAPTLKAKREGEAWLVSDAEHRQLVNGIALGQLLADLQMMQPKRLVSSKADAYAAKFEVAPRDARVTLLDAEQNVLLDIYVGKPATDLRSTYLRLAGDNRVLTVDKTLTWQVKRTPESWLTSPEPKGVPTE